LPFSAKEMINQRRSVRTFDGKPVTADDWNKLEEHILNMGNPFGVPVEFRLLDAKENDLTSPVIIGENAYIAAPANTFYMTTYELEE
jgi:hypothetical protein